MSVIIRAVEEKNCGITLIEIPDYYKYYRIILRKAENHKANFL